MPNTAPLTERHVGLHIFDGWPVSALRTLRAAAIVSFDHGSGDGHTAWAFDKGASPLNHIELCWRSEWLGEPMHQGTASQGSRYLANHIATDWPRRPTLGSRWGGCPMFFELNEVGLTYAAMSLAHYPPQCVLEGVAVAVEDRPPDTITPLWRVLTDTAEVLVIAADAPSAIALYEQTTGEEAHRAEAVDTTAPLVLGWSTRKHD